MSRFDCIQRIWRSLSGVEGKGRSCKQTIVPFDPHARGPRRLLTLGLVAVLSTPLILTGQQPPVARSDQSPSDAPGMEAASVTPGHEGTASTGSATISGTVLDTNGAEIQDAHVTLNSLSGAEIRTTSSDSNGEFTITGLPSGSFKLTVSGQGWGTYVSPDILLHAGDFHLVKGIVLPVTASAVVRVVANREELAEEQVHIAEQQRVLGVFPNFYSSYDWNAPPMGPKQKFQLVFRSLTDPMTFVGAGATAGIEQKANVFPGYGTGLQGYAKRFGAAYADDFTADTLAYAVFPSLFHQDPRYFYRGSGSIGSRALYAIFAAVRARGDNRRWEPNYSYILGSFTAGGLSNLYYPAGNRGVSLTIMNGLVDVGEHAGTNLVREFVLKRFTSRASGDTTGNP